VSGERYGRVRRDFWRHDKTRALSVHAKLLLVYLATGGHWACIRQASIAQLAIGLGLGRDGAPAVRAALEELVAAGIVRWDEWTEVVWLVEGLDEQITRWNRNLAKSLEAHLEDLPRSDVVCEFRRRYADRVLRKPEPQLDSGPEPELDCGRRPGSEFGRLIPQPQPQPQDKESERTYPPERTRAVSASIARAHESGRGVDPHLAWHQLAAELQQLGPLSGGNRVNWGGPPPRGYAFALELMGDNASILQRLTATHRRLSASTDRDQRAWYGRRLLGSEAAVERLAQEPLPDEVPTQAPKRILSLSDI
jgi:hypothetical protein